MTSDLPDDPYHALGLTKDATPAAIKTAYRKLVLKHHPDKVQDDNLKQSAADLFHKIQAAWETIGDEDKRARYDAQCKLAALRKEIAADRSGQMMPGAVRSDLRSQSYKSPETRSYPSPQRTSSYRTEEIRPTNNGPDYFDKPRTRDYDDVQQFDRPRRTPPREDRRSRVTRQDSKESERARRSEKVRQSTKATNRDRDYKYARAEVESDSESDYYAESRRRGPRQVDDERRERERYLAQVRRQQEEAASNRYYDERTQQKFADAQEHIQRSGAARRQYSDSPRRPSPPRTSSRDYPDVMMKDGRPVGFRRASGKPRAASGRDDDYDEKPRRRGLFDRSSSDFDEAPRRPIGLSSTKSAPDNIRLPYEKPRASSLQHTREEMAEFVPSPVKRADSMPQQPSRTKPTRSSTLHQMQNAGDDYGSPRRTTSNTKSRKEYADDNEYATPDGYIIENREPSRRNRSPESSREKTRSTSTRFPVNPTPVIPPPLTSRTTSYTVSPTTGKADVLPSRPKLARGDSGRRGSSSLLFREVPSPRDRESYPDYGNVREIFPETLKMQSGYSSNRRSSEARSPGTHRGNSFSATPPPMPA